MRLHGWLTAVHHSMGSSVPRRDIADEPLASTERVITRDESLYPMTGRSPRHEVRARLSRLRMA
jgi:hypothetical protein